MHFLFEVLNRCLEHLDVVVAGNILVKSLGNTLRVAHLAEYSAVGGSDTLDSIHRIVGVEGYIAGCIAVKVNILRGNLTVCGKLLDKLLTCKEATLAVRNRNVIDIADVCKAQPRRLIGSDSCSYNSRLVAGDGVEGKSGTAFISVDNLAVGHKAKLDKCLEAVADTAHQAVTVIEKVMHAVLNCCVSEEGCDELA